MSFQEFLKLYECLNKKQLGSNYSRNELLKGATLISISILPRYSYILLLFLDKHRYCAKVAVSVFLFVVN